MWPGQFHVGKSHLIAQGLLLMLLGLWQALRFHLPQTLFCPGLVSSGAVVGQCPGQSVARGHIAAGQSLLKAKQSGP